MHRNPPPEEIRFLLRSARNIAVVGLSDNPSRPSHQVARAMQRYGFRILPVNPNLRSPVLGERPYSSVREIPEPVDIVDVFRRSEAALEAAEDAVAAGARVLWMQLGVVNEEAASLAAAKGLVVVMDRCIKVDYAVLVAGSRRR